MSEPKKQVTRCFISNNRATSSDQFAEEIQAVSLAINSIVDYYNFKRCYMFPPEETHFSNEYQEAVMCYANNVRKLCFELIVKNNNDEKKSSIGDESTCLNKSINDKACVKSWPPLLCNHIKNSFHSSYIMEPPILFSTDVLKSAPLEPLGITFSLPDDIKHIIVDEMITKVAEISLIKRIRRAIRNYETSIQWKGKKQCGQQQKQREIGIEKKISLTPLVTRSLSALFAEDKETYNNTSQHSECAIQQKSRQTESNSGSPNKESVVKTHEGNGQNGRNSMAHEKADFEPFTFSNYYASNNFYEINFNGERCLIIRNRCSRRIEKGFRYIKTLNKKDAIPCSYQSFDENLRNNSNRIFVGCDFEHELDSIFFTPILASLSLDKNVQSRCSTSKGVSRLVDKLFFKKSKFLIRCRDELIKSNNIRSKCKKRTKAVFLANIANRKLKDQQEEEIVKLSISHDFSPYFGKAFSRKSFMFHNGKTDSLLGTMPVLHCKKRNVCVSVALPSVYTMCDCSDNFFYQQVRAARCKMRKRSKISRIGSTKLCNEPCLILDAKIVYINLNKLKSLRDQYVFETYPFVESISPKFSDMNHLQHGNLSADDQPQYNDKDLTGATEGERCILISDIMRLGNRDTSKWPYGQRRHLLELIFNELKNDEKKNVFLCPVEYCLNSSDVEEILSLSHDYGHDGVIQRNRYVPYSFCRTQRNENNFVEELRCNNPKDEKTNTTNNKHVQKNSSMLLEHHFSMIEKEMVSSDRCASLVGDTNNKNIFLYNKKSWILLNEKHDPVKKENLEQEIVTCYLLRSRIRALVCVLGCDISVTDNASFHKHKKPKENAESSTIAYSRFYLGAVFRVQNKNNQVKGISFCVTPYISEYCISETILGDVDMVAANEDRNDYSESHFYWLTQKPKMVSISLRKLLVLEIDGFLDRQNKFSTIVDMRILRQRPDKNPYETTLITDILSNYID